jgi:release factor glutamine methyltransferase
MDSSDDISSFHFQNMRIFTHPEVYEPAEDTFLFIETLDVDACQEVLEIGAGTGIISLYCAQYGADVICTDINPHAVALIKRNILENKSQIKGSIEVRKGNLFDIIKDDEKFDMVLFNPPYLPTTPGQKQEISQWYARSFDGGNSGLKITKRFIFQVRPYLKEQGKAIFIASSFSKKDKLTKIIDRSSLIHQELRHLRCDEEILTVHQLSRQ